MVRPRTTGRTSRGNWPDAQNLEVGKRNARINELDKQITFLQGAIGAEPGAIFQFEAESDCRPYDVKQ